MAADAFLMSIHETGNPYPGASMETPHPPPADPPCSSTSTARSCRWPNPGRHCARPRPDPHAGQAAGSVGRCAGHRHGSAGRDAGPLSGAAASARRLRARPAAAGCRAACTCRHRPCQRPCCRCAMPWRPIIRACWWSASAPRSHCTTGVRQSWRRCAWTCWAAPCDTSPGWSCCTANACWRSGPQAWTKATPLRPSCAKRRSPAAPRCLPVTMSRTSGFAVVQAHGGMAIKVGEGATRARHRLGSPQAAHAWLKSACMHLAAQTCAEVLP